MREDRSPQAKAQLARALVSLWSTERTSTGPNPAGIAAVAAKFHTPPALAHMVHKDKESHDQLSWKNGRIRC